MGILTRSLIVATIATTLGALSASTASAQDFKDRTTFTETEPFEVGTFRLEPGTYLIRMAQLTDKRNILQVVSTDQRKVYAMVITTPHPIRGDQASAGASFTYFPPIGEHPKALRTWFPSNSPNGEDIVYSKKRAVELAAVVKAPVPYVPEETKETEYKTVRVEEARPAEVVVERKVVAPPAPEPVRIAESLPRTAGRLPLAAALGGLLIAAAIALRAVAARV